MLGVSLCCLNDLLSPNSTVLWSLPPHTEVCECLQTSPVSCASQSLWQNKLCNIGGITSTTRQLCRLLDFILDENDNLREERAVSKFLVVITICALAMLYNLLANNCF